MLMNVPYLQNYAHKHPIKIAIPIILKIMPECRLKPIPGSYHPAGVVIIQ